MTNEQTFGKFTYDETLAFYNYARANPRLIMGTGETCREWFVRHHEITGAEFEEIKQARELADKLNRGKRR